jgi:hypothetical protein
MGTAMRQLTSSFDDASAELPQGAAVTAAPSATGAPASSFLSALVGRLVAAHRARLAAAASRAMRSGLSAMD